MSPLLIRTGPEALPSPLLGVTVGIAVTAVVYGLTVAVVRRGPREPVPHSTLGLLAVAGTLVGGSIWLQWTAFDLARVAVVLAVLQLSAPVVVLVSPFVSGDPLDRGGVRLWTGLALIVAGSLVLVLTPDGPRDGPERTPAGDRRHSRLPSCTAGRLSATDVLSSSARPDGAADAGTPASWPGRRSRRA